MADTIPQDIGLSIGPNKKLVQGVLIINKNGDAEWYQKSPEGNRFVLPTFTSNKSNNYTWQPSPNCGNLLVGNLACPTEEQRRAFYANTSSVTTLNNARLDTFRSPDKFNSPTLAQQLNIPGSNTAQTPTQQPPVAPAPSPTDTAGGTSPSPTDPDASSTPVIKVSGFDNINDELVSDNKYAPPNGLRYPIKYNPDQDFIKFQAHSIKQQAVGRGFINSSTDTSGTLKLGTTFKDLEFDVADGPIFLPIQASISDQNSVDWGPDSVNAIDAAVYNASLDLIKKEKGEIGNTLAGYIGAITKAVSEQDNRLTRYVAGLAANINNILPRTDNVILNPNMELLFQGPTLRPFSFSFKLSAREQREATVVKQIIKYFKANMAVRKEQNNIFLRAPRVFKIQYVYRSDEAKDHPGLNLIKMCALTNMSVDYTPLGSYMTYRDGTMVSYNISLQFQELNPIYQDDYDEFKYGDKKTVPNPIIGP